MFTRDKVNKVIEVLQSKGAFFVSEAHLQMSFILEAYKLYSNDFEFIPEYSIPNKTTGHDEIDLVIVDKQTNEKTFIEFKHKTKNDDKNPISLRI